MPFVELPKLNMHYETGGQGKNILLLVHGNFASWRWWQPVVKNPPRKYRVYAPDMRGCGDSDRPEADYTITQHAEDLYHFIKTLNLPRLHLVGHSLGGGVALEFALKYPKRIKTLTLVAPAPAEGRSVLEATSCRPSFARNASAMYSAFNLAERSGANRRELKKALTRMMRPEQIEVDFETLVNDAVRMSCDAAVGHIQTLNEWDVRDSLGGLKMPVLIIGGKEDDLISPKNLKKIARKIPKGRVMIWRGVKHAPQLDHPQRFKNALLKFTNAHNAWPIFNFRNYAPQAFKNASIPTYWDSHLMFD